MRVEVLLLFLVVGVGIYLMRFLPLLWALRRAESGGSGGRSGSGAARTSGRLLSLVGPAVVAALLVTSILPATSEPGYAAELVGRVVALVPTVIVAVRSGSLGLTVLAGVSSYGLVSLVA